MLPAIERTVPDRPPTGGTPDGVRLSLLGAPVVERAGETMVFDTRKATAVLAYLAATGRVHRRETLAALGWPDTDRERAAAALRRTLSTIRRVAGADVLVTDAGTVGLDRNVWVDVHAARSALASTRTHDHRPTEVCHACVGPLSTVADLHRGPFLEGFALRDSAEFEDWCLRTAEELERELADALSRLVDAHVAAGALEEAVDFARRRLSLDPLHEPAHRMVMRLYAWQGRRSAALRQYRECVRILEAELGVTPLDDTTRTYEDILADRLEAPGNHASAVAHQRATVFAHAAEPLDRRLARRLAPADPETQRVQAGPASSGPANAGFARNGLRFVARDREMVLLTQLLEQTRHDGILIAIEGEAGIGKTRLLAELRARPPLQRRPVLHVACQQDEAGLAFGAIVEALRSADTGSRIIDRFSHLPEHTARELARVLPELIDRTGRPPPADGPGATWRLHDALATALTSAVHDPGGATPGVLVIDDAHWLDESSLDVIAHLAHRLRDRPVCVVLAWRTELVGRGHRLRRLVADLGRQGTASTITLHRLDEAAVRTLLMDSAGTIRTDVDELTDSVMASTEGVPLLVVEYLAALARDASALDGPTPRGARDLFLARLASVGDSARQVLTTAAVIGRPFDPDLVRRASGRTDDETAAALEELVAARLIKELDGDSGQYDFTHARLRAVVYDDAGLARRRLLHRRIAAALERRNRDIHTERSLAVAVTIAAHHRAAGDEPMAAQWLVTAAEGATDMLAVPDAVAHYEEALALGHPDRGRIYEALGQLHTLSGTYAAALYRFEAAAALVDDERFPALEHKIAGVYVRWGRWVLADQHLAIALGALADRDSGQAAALRARVLTDRGLVAHHLGREEEAASCAQAAVAAAESADDLAALAGAHNLLGVLSKRKLSLARHHLEHALALARRLHDLATEVAAANNLAQAHAAAGSIDLALPLAEAVLERADMLGDRHRQAALHNNLADLLRAAGRHDEAMTHLKKAVTLFAEVGQPGVPEPGVWKLAEW